MIDPTKNQLPGAWFAWLLIVATVFVVGVIGTSVINLFL